MVRAGGATAPTITPHNHILNMDITHMDITRITDLTTIEWVATGVQHELQPTDHARTAENGDHPTNSEMRLPRGGEEAQHEQRERHSYGRVAEIGDESPDRQNCRPRALRIGLKWHGRECRGIWIRDDSPTPRSPPTLHKMRENISPSRKFARIGCGKSSTRTAPSQPRSIGKSHDVQCRSAAASGKATGGA